MSDLAQAARDRADTLAACYLISEGPPPTPGEALQLGSAVGRIAMLEELLHRGWLHPPDNNITEDGRR